MKKHTFVLGDKCVLFSEISDLYTLQVNLYTSREKMHTLMIYR